MIEVMSLTQLQQIVGGELAGDARFTSLSTDTRTIQEGDLFVALKGPNFNGNEFVGLAEQKQACAALIGESVETTLPSLLVSDTRIALGKIAASNRLHSAAKVIGLTGSQGKTSVKEMTASILGRKGEVLFTQGNFNNDYGVPFTLLRIAQWHDFAVIELGASGLGEIAYTTALVRPDIALINNVAATHVEGFGSLQGVAKGKAEIWQGLSSGGTAIINIDDDCIVSEYPERSDIHKVTISASGAEADYFVTDVSALGLAGSSFTLHSPKGQIQVSIVAPGQHNIANALSAAALAMEAGAELEDISAGLAAMQNIQGRLQILNGQNGSVILDDSYNASPASFKAAIDVLAALPGIRIIAAGDMGELGKQAVEEHQSLGEYASAKGVDFFFATGELGRHAVSAFSGTAVHAEDCDELATLVQEKLATGVSVLVKGSRGARMERVVKQITEQED